ncbi:MAG: glycosyltransferase family 2 protein [Propioniciclava sp.]|uniref:glycosyltransferase family 2 protein n=1 Tax=Propioniciclava sp. TaxID=2038686 RepID=UPI0039E6472C
MPAPHTRVALVMRTEGGPVLFRRALADVAAQEFTDWRLVVIGTGDVAPLRQELAALDADLADRIELLALEASASLGTAINAGLAATSSDYVALHDGGDTWEPGFLSATVAHLDAHAAQAAVVTRGETVFEEQHGSHLVETERSVPAPHLASAPLSDLLTGRLAPIQLLYRRSVHDELGELRTDVGAAAIWEFCLRLARTFEIGTVEETLAFAHQRPGEASTADERSAEAHLRDAYLQQSLAEGGGAEIHLSYLISAEFAELRRRNDDLARRLDELSRGGRQLAAITARLDAVERRFDDISEHLGHIERLVAGSRAQSESRFDATSEHLGHLERRIADVEHTVLEAGLAGTLRRKYQALRARRKD